MDQSKNREPVPLRERTVFRTNCSRTNCKSMLLPHSRHRINSKFNGSLLSQHEMQLHPKVAVVATLLVAWSSIATAASQTVTVELVPSGGHAHCPSAPSTQRYVLGWNSEGDNHGNTGANLLQGLDPVLRTADQTGTWSTYVWTMDQVQVTNLKHVARLSARASAPNASSDSPTQLRSLVAQNLSECHNSSVSIDNSVVASPSSMALGGSDLFVFQPVSKLQGGTPGQVNIIVKHRQDGCARFLSASANNCSDSTLKLVDRDDGSGLQRWVVSTIGSTQGTTPVAFQGSAFLIQYYAGVVATLLQRGVIVPGVTPLSGLSGGAYTSVLTTIGWNGTRQSEFWNAATTKVAETYSSPAGHLNEVVQPMLNSLLPANVANQITGKVQVGLSQLDASKDTLNGSAAWIVNSWSSKEDVVNSLLGTDYIPCFTGPTLYTEFRSQPVIDGGFSLGFEQLCSNQSNCIKVASYYVGSLANMTCDPLVCPQAAESGCMDPVRVEPVTTQLYNNSKNSEQWNISHVKNSCPSSPSATGPTPPFPLPAFVPQNSTTPDIHPGKYTPLPLWTVGPRKGHRVLACEWDAWAMNPPSDPPLFAYVMELVYKQGAADAAEWCRQNGY